MHSTAATRRALTVLICAAVALAPASQPVWSQAAVARAGAIVASDYESCQSEDEASFRTAVETITRKALASGLSTLDLDAIVREEWRERDLDDVIDKRVDLAIAEVRDESSWTSLLESLAFRERARELATAVAERVYRSDAVTSAISSLADGVGVRVGNAIELSTIDAAGPAQQCVKAFLSRRYGDTVASAVEQDAAAAFKVAPGSGAAKVGSGDVLMDSAGGVAGAIVLMVRRQLSRMASRFGQRIIGAVLGRIVSVAAGGIGVALIAKDIWDLRHGMLPIISEEMKSTETKASVQHELAQSIGHQITQQNEEIAAATSERIIEIWRSFQRAHTKVLELAEKNADFRAFVDTVGKDSLARLDEIVALILPKGGEEGVLAALKDGRLHTAVTRLSEPALRIARETQSLDDALKWSAVAGPSIDRVLELGLHTRAAPDDFSGPNLQRLIGLDNRAAQLKLASIPRADREILFELDDARLTALGRGLGEAELTELSGYLRGLSKSASQTVLAAVAAAPAQMRELASPRVRDWVLSSRDQDAAVALVLRTGVPAPGAVVADVRRAIDGDIHPLLIWEAYPVIVVAAGFLLVLLLLLVRSVLLGGRRKPASGA